MKLTTRAKMQMYMQPIIDAHNRYSNSFRAFRLDMRQLSEQRDLRSPVVRNNVLQLREH